MSRCRCARRWLAAGPGGCSRVDLRVPVGASVRAGDARPVPRAQLRAVTFDPERLDKLGEMDDDHPLMVFDKKEVLHDRVSR
jgi:hypothetical protein